MAWLTGWQYRKSITLHRSSGSVTNYQMLIVVGESSGASIYDVHCHGHIQSDFNDLRFTKSDGTTTLNYWIEDIIGSSPNRYALVWVKFDSIGTTATTFYMYYGKSSATPVSSLADTVDNYEDFEGGTLGKFSNLYASDYLSVQSDVKKQGTYAVRANDTSSSSGGGRYSNQNTFWNEDNKRFLFYMRTDQSTIGWLVNLMRATTQRISVILNNGTPGCTTTGQTLLSSAVSTGVWYRFFIKARHGSSSYDIQMRNASYQLLGELSNVSMSNTSVSYRDMMFYTGVAALGSAYGDLAVSLKYVDPEPSWGSWGNEESAIPIDICVNNAWKDVSEMKICLSQQWKNISEVKICIGNTWKNLTT